MTLRGLMHLVLPCAIFVLIVIAPLSIAIDGRNIENIDFFAIVDADGPGAWLSRVSTLVILAICATTIAVTARFVWAPPSVATLVMLGYLAFYVTNSILNSMFGTVPAFNRYQIYPVIILAAIYMQREDGNERLIDVAKAALLCVLLVSLLFAFLRPLATLRTYAPEVRLPFVGFRFWGLANSPNSIAPLSLLLILLMIHRPFRSQIATLVALFAASLVLVLAQSQTAWLTALIVMPALLIYRWRVDEIAALQPARTNAVSALVFCLVVAGAAIYVLTSDFTSEITVDDRAFTGRGKIWRVAIDLFRDNPLFGYGPSAWEQEFRIRVGMPFAFTAHNQVLQTLSTAGLFGLAGLVLYLGTLIIAAARLARPTRGLAPAMLLSFPLIRSFSEASFEFKSILGDEFILHMILFMVMTTTSPATDEEPEHVEVLHDRRMPVFHRDAPQRPRAIGINQRR